VSLEFQLRRTQSEQSQKCDGNGVGGAWKEAVPNGELKDRIVDWPLRLARAA
jgi:hypothetical protein